MPRPMTINGQPHDLALRFAKAAQRVARAHYKGRPPNHLQKELQLLSEDAEAITERAERVAALLLTEGVDGVDGDSVEITATFSSHAHGKGIAENHCEKWRDGA